jgi:2-keto-4-pentenoate hydratase
MNHASLAEELFAAERDRAPIAPITERHPDATVADAYAIQVAGRDMRCGGGAKVRGHKVGLTARAMQVQFGVTTPDYGFLLDSMFVAEAEVLPARVLIQPRVEPEVAFVLGRPLKGPGVTAADVMRATEFVCPSLEIIDSRIKDWKIQLIDTISDNASSARVVLGGRCTRLEAVDLRQLPCTLTQDGAIALTGTAAAVLGNPINAVTWLANTLGRLGVTLEDGDVILPGSCTAALTCPPGSYVRADFGPLGGVAVGFA